MNDQGFSGWAVVEIMGHQRAAGFVSELPVAGVKMLRVQTPNEDTGFASEVLLGGASIFRITPCPEATIRAHAQAGRASPLQEAARPRLSMGSWDDSDDPPDPELPDLSADSVPAAEDPDAADAAARRTEAIDFLAGVGADVGREPEPWETFLGLAELARDGDLGVTVVDMNEEGDELPSLRVVIEIGEGLAQEMAELQAGEEAKQGREQQGSEAAT